MKKYIMILVLAFLTVSVWADDKPVSRWETYNGAWFQILYPDEFLVKPSLKDRNMPSAFSSVFFSARNGDIEFYVLAPKYGMEPTDIALDPQQENLVSENKTNNRGLIYKHTVISAKDGSYVRVIENHTDTSGPNSFTRRTFSVKYRNQGVFDEYRATYEMFKNSYMKRLN